jgi:hypothetical protein
MLRRRFAVLATLALLAMTTLFAQPLVLDSSSTSLVHLCFGGWYWPNAEGRYAEGWLEVSYTAALAHPTYLNVIHSYSQSSGSCSVKVYISTARQTAVSQTDPHNHCCWFNADSATPDYYVGQFTSVNSPVTLTSFDIESYISAHPSLGYTVLFDQQDDPADEGIVMTWLGPQGRVGALAEVVPTFPAKSRGVTCAPNPTTGPAEIHYSVSHPGEVGVFIVDAAGRRVRTLYSGFQPAGSSYARWDGQTDGGARAASGTYFFEITTADARSIGKVVLQ